MDRKQRILGSIRPAEMRGLEIGVLDNPVIRKSDGDVLYVDYADTEHLRKNQFSDTVKPEDICEVDIVWAERPLSECVGAPVDYVVASHVIEHVPDFIGWLHDLHGALKRGGIISLAVPDKRFTFDILRPVSTTGQMVESFLKKQVRPSIAQKFDFTSMWRKVDVKAAWKRELVENELIPITPTANAVAWDQGVILLSNAIYMDSHCWVFTPRSFLQAAKVLADIKLFPFKIAKLYPTQIYQMEFIVHLETCEAEDGAVVSSIQDAMRQLDKSVSERLYRSRQMQSDFFFKGWLPSFERELRFVGRHIKRKLSKAS